MSSSLPMAQPDSRRWFALGVLLVGTLLPPLDFFIVNVALPEIRRDFATSSDLAQLVVSVYATAYAVTLILGGRLGDMFGRKRVYLGGMLGFGIASALCGFAPTPAVLIAGRLLQGVAAAIMAPQSMALIHATFPAEEKNRALGLYGATFGLAAVLGQVLSGVLIEANPFGLGWRSIFLINLPVILCALPAALAALRESRAPQPGRLDVMGAGLLAAGLLALVVPLVEGPRLHWPWWSLPLLVVSGGLLITFWRYEQRKEAAGETPLVLPSLLAAPRLRRSLLATFLFYALAPFFLVFAVYQQAGLGHGALAAGWAILPLGIGFLLGPLCSPHLAQRLGARTAAFGMALEVMGLLLAAALAGLPSWLPVPLLLIGLGQGIALPALVRVNADQMAPSLAGLAAGLTNATLQISAALAVALIGGLFFALAPDGAGGREVQTAFSAAALTMGGALALAAVLSWPSAPATATRGACDAD
ncbi:MFS transporter [Pseudomonas oryzihabitans]|uniref:MFS transporter n=1 Tax=Pseudomonas oryzihabitans TaxID=47885 RepID=UPI001D611D38|nr:MFS transporter [Pseudomonas oryzihabitans]HJE69128.1 MFS transporter [Pseudomonas oryzihabitans]